MCDLMEGRGSGPMSQTVRQRKALEARWWVIGTYEYCDTIYRRKEVECRGAGGHTFE